MSGKSPKRVFDFYQLEDRILLSGDGLEGVDLPDDPALTAALLAELGEAEGEASVAPIPSAQEPAAEPISDLADAPTFDPALPLEVVFVDAGVQDAQTLLDGLRDASEQRTQWLVVELSGDEDGVEQISRTLAGLSGVDAIHLLSHGAGRGIKLGNVWLDLDSAAGHVGSLAAWGHSLDADADLLIYGCDLASTAEGRDLLELIALTCDCDVAASDDATGHETLGGDWLLEYQTGKIETQIVVGAATQAQWEGLLATFTVTNTNDSGAGSLRQAILDANALAGHDTIQFAIAGTGVHTIDLGSSLTITDAVTIDATTDDSFAANSNRPAIILDGNNSFIGDGFVLTSTADGTTIRGFVIRDFTGDGIEIQANSNGNAIAGNYIGRLTSSGTDAGASEANTASGINVLGANNTIGGTLAADRNVISGNTGSGILISDASATGNVVAGNYISLLADGTTALVNNLGVTIDAGASSNTIGGSTTAHRNAISGNTVDGVQTINVFSSNTIQNNYIGTDTGGTLDLGNADDGVDMDTCSLNNLVIGNLLSGNNSNGIDLGGSGVNASGTVIQGNLIGAQANGTSSLENRGIGIVIGNGGTANNTTIDQAVLEAPVSHYAQADRHNYEVVFIEAGLEDSDFLIADLQRQADSLGRSLSVVVLSGTENGFDQINSVLSQYSDLNAIHIVSHGTDGMIQLGGSWLTAANVQEHFSDLQKWGVALSESGDILIYGCDVAQSDFGQSLIESIAAFTGADVAASDDQTGHASLGGDWELEQAIGWIETEVTFSEAFRSQWVGLLPTYEQQISTPNNDAELKSDQNWGQTFQHDSATATYTANGISLQLRRESDALAQNITVSLRSSWDGVNLASATIESSSLSTSYAWCDFNFDSLSLNDNQTYFIRVTSDSTNGKIWVGGSNSNVYANGSMLDKDGFAQSGDLAFKVTGPNASVANTVTVTNTLDVSNGNVSSIDALIASNGGDGISLREAIAAANNSIGVNTINFNIAAALVGGTHTINISTALPTIRDAVIINGLSEPDYVSGTPVVRIDGAAAGFSGISISAGGGDSTIQGLRITGFTVDGINVASGANNLTIADNWIGTNGTSTSGHGNANVGNTDDGIDIAGSNANILRNVITNNNDEGIDIVGSGVTGHIIQGNYIGLDPDGSTSVTGNWDVGIAIISGSGNTIGGTTVAARNVISRNNEGIEINTSDNLVQGNYIGTDASGTVDKGNRVGNGVQIRSGTGNVVGGTANDAGNLIAFNDDNGVDVEGGTGTAILGNQIHSNTLLGINLGTAGVTTNDSNDGDSGANNLQNYPVLVSAVTNGSQIIVGGTLNSQSNKTYRIEFFANSAIDNEGQRYLGFTTVNTPVGSPFTVRFTTTLTASVTAGEYITATATDPTNNTSEFSAYYRARGTSGLWLSSTTSATAGGVTWDSNRTAQFGGPNLTFEPGTTSGTLYSTEFDLTDFGAGVNMNGLHYVSRTVTVGSANAVTLLPGDVLFSLAQNETLGGVSISADDIALFRPTIPGNYSAGTFSVLLQNPMAGQATRDFALVETSTVVGGVTLNAGDFLLTAAGGTYESDITRYQVTDVGPGTTSGTRSELIDGSSAGIGIAKKIFGLELVHANATLGGTALSAGQILISLDANDTVGSNNLSVTTYDIFALTVTATGTGTSSGTASLLVQGSDIGLTAGGEEYDAIALLPLNNAPTLDASRSPTLNSMNEDAVAPSGAVGTLISSLVDFSSPTGQVDNVTDLDASPMLGIAVTTADTTNGAWFYSINGGTNWSALGAVTGSAARLLAADANTRLYFQPNANYSGTLASAITFRAWDQTSGTNGSTADTSTNGGAAAFSTATDSASLVVNALNDAPTFTSGAGTGKVTTAVSSASDIAVATLIQTDGRIVVLGSNGSTSKPYVACYNADGTLDAGFGTGGISSLSFSAFDDAPSALARQADGKLLVAGTTNNSDFFVARLNADGTLDTTFDGDGIAWIDFAGGMDTARSIAVQSDGNIVVAGVATVAGNPDFALARLNSNGSLDTSFDTDGKVTTAIGAGADEAKGLAIQPDGKIILAGFSHNGSNDDVALVRYNANGSLDTSFDGDGKRTLALGTGYDRANTVAVQADGKIVVGGDALIAGSPDFAVMRFNSDGSLDNSFDTDGIVTTEVSSFDYAPAMVLQADGKIVLAGFAFTGLHNDFALVRYNSNGSLDTTFDGDGKVLTAIGAATDQASAVAVQSDGMIVAAGYGTFASADTALVRYNANGSLDTTFGATSTLNGAPTFIENGSAVVLDSNVTISDAELSAANNFSGASLTLVRSGGASSQDVYSATGTLGALTQGGSLVVSSTTVGTVTTNSSGTLALTFNSSATNALVNSVMQQIAYSNSSDAPPGQRSGQLDVQRWQ